MAVTQKFRHPHLCRNFDVYKPNLTKVIIVSEYYEVGCVLSLVLRKKRIEEPNAARMYRQLCEAVHYLHTRGVAHRVPANSPSVSARVLIEKLLEEDDRQRASYKDCVGSEVMHLYVSAKWILADNRFVYEIIP
ncbi:CAMK protein kinase [Aphelenchoides avenae]|nr:CAMK protein kinase [Aphelenchus avenae]